APVTQQVSLGGKDIDITASSGNDRTAEQEYLASNQQNISQPRYYVQENGQSIEVRLQEGKFTDAAGRVYTGQRVTQIHLVQGMRAAVSQQTGNLRAGRGAGGIGEQGQNIVYVDAGETIDFANPFTSQAVLHERNELSREVRMGKMLQERIGTVEGETPAQRLARSAQALPAMQNAHENAPSLEKGVRIAVPENQSLPINTILAPKFTTGPPVQHQPMPLLIAASGGHATATTPVVNQSSPTQYLLTQRQKLEQELARLTLETYLAQAESLRSGESEPPSGLKTLIQKHARLEGDLAYVLGMAKYGAGINNRWDRIRFALSSGRRNEVRARVIEDIYGSKEKLEKRISDLQAERERAAKLSDEDFARQHGFSSDGQQLTDETRRTITWLRDMTNQGLDSQIDELQIYGGKFNLRAHFYYAERERKQAQAGFMASAMEAGLKPEDVGLAAWPEFTQDIRQKNRGVYQSGDKVIEVIPTANSDQRRGAIENLAELMPGRHIVGNNGNVFLLSRVEKGKEYLPFQERASALGRAQRQLLGWSLDRLQKLTGASPIISDEQKKVLAIVVEGERIIAEAARILSSDGSLDVKDAHYFIFHPGNKSLKFRLPEGVSLPQESTILTEQELRVLQQGISANTEERNRERFEAAWAKLTRFIEATAQGSLPAPEAKQVSSWNDISHQEAINAVRTQLAQLHQGISPKQQQQELERLISIDAGSAQNKAEALRRIQHINTLLAAEGKEPQNLAEGTSYFDKQAYDELEAVKKQIDEGVKDPKWSDAGHVGRRQQDGIVEFFALRDNPKTSSVWSEEIEKAIGRARSIVRTRLVKERDRLLKTQLAVPADTHAAVLANADEILLPAELTGALKLKGGENLWEEMTQQQRKQFIRRIRHSVESILRASEKAREALRKEIESSRQMLKAMKAVEAIKEEALALASGKKNIKDAQYFVTRNAGRGLKFRYPAVGTSAPEGLTTHELMVLRKGTSENTSPQNRKVYQDALRKIYRYAGNTLEEEVAKVRTYMDAQVARGVPQDKMVWPNGKAELEYGKKVKQKRSTLKAAGYDEESLLQYVVVTQRSFLQNEMELLRQLTISRSEPGALAKASRAIDTIKNKQDTAEKQQREVQNLDNQRKNLAGQSRKQREQIQDRQKVLEDALRAVLMVLADKPADESLSAPLDLSGSATLFEKEVSRQLQADLDENAVEQAPRDSQRVRVIRAILAGREDASRTFEREQRILRETREKITKRLEQERSQLEQELTKAKDEVAKELQAEQARAEQKVAELADKMHQAYQQAQVEGREIKLPEYAFNVPYRTPEAKEEPLPVPVEVQGETAGKIDIEPVKQEVRKLDKESLSGFERIVVDGSLNGQPFKREKAAEGDKQVLRVNPAYMRVMPGILKAGLNGKDGVVSQAVELLPHLIKANGDLQGTDLGRIAKGLVNSDATRRERTQLARRLINSLEQANNGTGKKLGGARRLWEARKLAWDVEQTVRSNEFQPRINSQGRLLLSDESSPYADVVVPLVRLVERLPQLPEDALMSVVNGRHISRLMNSTSQPAVTPKVASSHGKPKPPLSTVSFLGTAWLDYAVRLAAWKLGQGGSGTGGGVSGRGIGLGGNNIGKGKGGSAAQVRRPEILKQALQTVVGQETRGVNRTAQVPQVPANGDSNPANRNPQSNALPPVTPLLPNNGLGGVGTFGAVVNTHSSTTGLSPSSILPNPDISTGFTGPNDAQRLMNAFGVQLLGQAGGIRPAAVVLPTTGSGLKEAGENIAGSTSIATEVGSETGVMASNSLTGSAQGTPEEKGVRAQGSGSATRQTTGRTDRARGLAVKTGSGNGIHGSQGVSGGNKVLPRPEKTGLRLSSSNQIPPQNTEGNHTARSPPKANTSRALISIVLIGIIGFVSCGCRSLSRERNPNYDPNQPHSLQNSPLTPQARLKHLQPILEKLERERKKASTAPVKPREVGVNGQVNSFGLTALAFAGFVFFGLPIYIALLTAALEFGIPMLLKLRHTQQARAPNGHRLLKRIFSQKSSHTPINFLLRLSPHTQILEKNFDIKNSGFKGLLIVLAGPISETLALIAYSLLHYLYFSGSLVFNVLAAIIVLINFLVIFNNLLPQKFCASNQVEQEHAVKMTAKSGLIIAVLLLTIIHEFSHFAVARLLGIRAKFSFSSEGASGEGFVYTDGWHIRNLARQWRKWFKNGSGSPAATDTHNKPGFISIEALIVSAVVVIGALLGTLVANIGKINTRVTQPYIAPSVAGVAVTAIVVIGGVLMAPYLRDLTPIGALFTTILTVGGAKCVETIMTSNSHILLLQPTAQSLEVPGRTGTSTTSLSRTEAFSTRTRKNGLTLTKPQPKLSRQGRRQPTPESRLITQTGSSSTKQGGVKWLKSIMQNLNLTTLLNSPKTTRYLQQLGRTAIAILGSFLFMKLLATSIPAMAGLIPGKSSLTTTVTLSLLALPLLAATVYLSIRSTARTTNTQGQSLSGTVPARRRAAGSLAALVIATPFLMGATGPAEPAVIVIAAIFVLVMLPLCMNSIFGVGSPLEPQRWRQEGSRIRP
ncbi:MAG: hypothetical protein PHT41_06120, partial [Candidatus Omnitrophica bacterium]|nr:hypothetical protein [Candidatus Omnitrophota bacterium]